MYSAFNGCWECANRRDNGGHPTQARKRAARKKENLDKSSQATYKQDVGGSNAAEHMSKRYWIRKNMEILCTRKWGFYPSGGLGLMLSAKTPSVVVREYRTCAEAKAMLTNECGRARSSSISLGV